MKFLVFSNVVKKNNELLNVWRTFAQFILAPHGSVHSAENAAKINTNKTDNLFK